MLLEASGLRRQDRRARAEPAQFETPMRPRYLLALLPLLATLSGCPQPQASKSPAPAASAATTPAESAPSQDVALRTTLVEVQGMT